MTPDPSQSGADDNGAAEPLTELLAQALAALEADGEPGVERLLLRYPEDADELRAALAELRGTGLLDEPRSELPERFGDFALEGRLGAGGMGVVFRARQLSLGRLVALKVLRPELLLFEGARDRFQREIDAVARLEHPAIVPILASGLAGGVPYFAMPLLRGGSGDDVVAALAAADPRRLVGADLHAAIGGDAATPDGDGVFANDYRQAVVRLVRKAALGIHHAHARGVLHRDLKPSNLMLTPDGQAIVLDFGLARGRDDARLTRTGSTAGSPAYMAPEQVRGEPADERTDVYALAATMHCLLGLRPPFPIACAEELRRRILAGEREDLRHRAGVPTELRLVLDRAMDLERHRRYPTALAFADDLQATLDGRAVTARRLPFAVRARRLVRRHRAVAAAVGVALLFLALLPLVLLWQQRRAAEVLTRQVDKTTAANSALAAANASLEEQVRRADRGVEVSIETVERLLANVAVDKLRNLPAALEMGADVLHDAIELFDRLVADERFRERIELARLRALYDLFELQDTLGRFDAAEQTAQQLQRGLAKWFAGAESVPAPVRLLLAKIHRLIASLRIKRGEMGSVAQHVEAARHGFEGLCDDAG
ncbi:MAG: serine/threonine protein kinase, partial [Planctomycetes bacterium]|nr:serine/threonine protein kinase [Planctomycetota bacterium]